MENKTPHTPARCRHLHTSGHQCGSPAVRHEKLCYQHLAATRRPQSTPTLPDPEDLHAVQRGLAELLRLVSRELIEDRQAKRLFLILTAAGTNLARIDRQQRADRELGLRERRLALAEARLRAQNPPLHPVILSEGEAGVEGPAVPAHAHASFSGCHSRRESASPATKTGCPTFATASSPLTWNRANEAPVTDWIDDPELGPLAPGPEPEPEAGFSGCHSRRESASPATETGCPTFATASPSRRWDRGAETIPKPQPELPSPARQRELDAEAAEQIEFMREENRRTEERASLRRAAYNVMYQNLTPEKRLQEDRRRAQLQADYNDCPLPLAPYPKWGITEQPF